VQTVVLDALVVDDPDTATVRDGSTIALSAAMPGIAGCMLRKSSRYAPMRSQLTHDHRSAAPAADREGDVTVNCSTCCNKNSGLDFSARAFKFPAEPCTTCCAAARRLSGQRS